MGKDVAAETSSISHLMRSPPGQFDAEELAQHHYTQRADCYGLLLIIAGYVALLLAICPDGERPHSSSAGCTVNFLQIVSTAIAVFNLHIEMNVVPRATKENADSFFVSYGPFGRWIYMTHHTIALMAVHAVVSLTAPFVNENIAFGTYVTAPIIGAMGTFVTIQYFHLVYPHPDHISECLVWADRGYNYKLVDAARHAPPLLLALTDMCVLKHRGTLLLVMPSAPSMFCLLMGYVSLALLLVQLNYSVTGRWPYGMMKGFEKNRLRWLGFMLVQGTLLWFFGLSLSMLASWAFAVW